MAPNCPRYPGFHLLSNAPRRLKGWRRGLSACAQHTPCTTGTSGCRGCTRIGGGYRRYESQHIDRIRFIKRAQALGFTLGEIETLLALEDGTDRKSVQRIGRARLGEIRARLADLRKLERTLTHLLRECEEERTPRCPIIGAIVAQ